MNRNKLLYLFFFLTIVVVYLIVFKNLIYSSLHSPDLNTHIRFAQKLLSYSLEHKLYFIPHPLFHILLIGFHFIFRSWEFSAIVLLTIFVALMYNFQILFLSRDLKVKFFTAECIVFSFVLLIVSSIYVPPLNSWLSPKYFSVMFSGSGTPNILHSPTYYLVKIFVLPLFYFSLKFLNRPSELSIKGIFVFTLILSLSILAKPNFALSFVPVITLLFTYYSLKEKNSIPKVFLNLVLFLIIPIIILFLQFFASYVAGPRDSTVSICFFCVWLNWSKIPLLSVILGIAFPLYMFLLNLNKNLMDIKYQLAWLNFLIALFFAGIFYETDYRFLAGNFFWGYNLSLFLLFYVSIVDFSKTFSESIKQQRIFRYKLIGAVALLFLHLAGGVFHFSLYMH